MQNPILKRQLDNAYQSLNLEEYFSNSQIGLLHKLKSNSGSTISDIELGAMLLVMVAWGNNNEQIMNASNKMMSMCSWKPSEFIKLGDFYDLDDDMQIYKTLNGKQLKKVCHALRMLYGEYDSIHDLLQQNADNMSFETMFMNLVTLFAPASLGNPRNASSCKRINLLLRWMVRKDDVDFGLWQTHKIQPSNLYAVMGAETSRIAKKMGLITFPAHTWQSTLELTSIYRQWDETDPLKYDLVFTSKFINQ